MDNNRPVSLMSWDKHPSNEIWRQRSATDWTTRRGMFVVLPL